MSDPLHSLFQMRLNAGSTRVDQLVCYHVVCSTVHDWCYYHHQLFTWFIPLLFQISFVSQEIPILWNASAIASASKTVRTNVFVCLSHYLDSKTTFINQVTVSHIGRAVVPRFCSSRSGSKIKHFGRVPRCSRCHHVQATLSPRRSTAVNTNVELCLATATV